jgi:hypothetical protein
MTAYSHAAAVQKIKSKKEGKANKPNASKPRLYAKGTFLGFRRCVCLLTPHRHHLFCPERESTSVAVPQFVSHIINGIVPM